MKHRLAVVFTVLLLAALGSSSAMAQRYHGGGHARVGIYLGAPLFGASFGSPFYDPFYVPRYYYPPSYYYPAPVVMAPAAAPVYIEQSTAQASPQQMPSNSWYYCQDPQGYYPYVKNCAVNWQQVPPAPQ
ncbi:MAG: hypothetical protein ACRYGK_03160 [Janthinobacterium lividum]